MNLVQRLTGSSSAAASSSSSNPFTDDPGAMSPAARYATIEKAKSPKDKGNSSIYPQSGNGDLGDFFMEGVEMGQACCRQGYCLRDRLRCRRYLRASSSLHRRRRRRRIRAR
ncbi:unnamed protein product [Linum tenue]|uniref:Uncharacterized protein n=1 Tax=Linum tenue TaxID=586396 RepID=A0AAV0RXD4_9ROSI|nr:unnamed protein product [Linum tenue]